MGAIVAGANVMELLLCGADVRFSVWYFCAVLLCGTDQRVVLLCGILMRGIAVLYGILCGNVLWYCCVVLLRGAPVWDYCVVSQWGIDVWYRLLCGIQDFWY